MQESTLFLVFLLRFYCTFTCGHCVCTLLVCSVFAIHIQTEEHTEELLGSVGYLRTFQHLKGLMIDQMNCKLVFYSDESQQVE